MMGEGGGEAGCLSCRLLAFSANLNKLNCQAIHVSAAAAAAAVAAEKCADP